MRVHHIAISVKNLENSANFYKNAFGFNEVRQFTKPNWDGCAIILELDGLQLELFHFQSSLDKKDDLSNLKIIGLKHIGIQVDNVREKFEELKNTGIDIDIPKKGTTCAWYCFLRDPDGIPIELYETLD